ncbi:MAG: hypothetical protein VB009_01225 [Erysipelotrichaceae bacterium]|nr:hypothetical protein [Erysipelotrichaceae bacterium]
MNKDNIQLRWQSKISIFANTTVLKQLFIAIGIPFLVVIFVLLMFNQEPLYTLYALILIGSLFLLTALLIRFLYRGVYEVEYLLYDDKIISRTVTSQRKKNNIVNRLAIFLGILSANPTVIGAGMLANARQSETLVFANVKKVKYEPSKYTITLYGKSLIKLIVFCDKENYQTVVDAIALRIK